MSGREVILVVDDQIPNLDLMAALLKQAGYEVLAATKGEEALERVHYAQPDLILLDVVMPGLDGYEVCRKLKEDEDTADIPVLFVSARDEAFDLVRAFRAGGVDYITKPFHEEEFLSRVETHLALRQSHKQLAEQNRQLQYEIAEREQVEQALREARDELVTLLAYSRSIVSTLELQPLLSLSLKLLKRVVEFDQAAVLTLEDEVFLGQATLGDEDLADIQAVQIPVKALPALQEMQRTLQGFFVSDERGDGADIWLASGEEKVPWSEAVRGIHSWIVMPLVVKNEVIGMLALGHRAADFYGSQTLDLLQVFANQLAIAIENAQLYGQVQEAATIAERSRLASELHDSVTQALFSANLVADVLPQIWEQDHAAGEEELLKLRRLTRGALAEMRGILLELRPSIIESANLSILLNQLSAAVAGQVEADVDATIEAAPVLPPEVKTVFYRVAQEALNNIVKHARATQIELSLRVSPVLANNQAEPWRGMMLLRIVDNGQGFLQQRSPAGGLRLNIMRERAESIDAELAIAGQQGRGTEVSLLWGQSEVNHE